MGEHRKHFTTEHDARYGLKWICKICGEKSNSWLSANVIERHYVRYHYGPRHTIA